MAVTMYTVQAIVHGPQGWPTQFTSRWRAGRKWHANEVVSIEVHDQIDDPAPDNSGVIRVGERTLAQLQGDAPYLTVTPE